MLPAPAYVISDAHLGYATRDIERAMLRFLRHLPGRAGSLVIDGDLFEFWFEWRHVIPRSAFRILGALAELRDQGLPVLMVAGNHDCWGGDVLRNDVGIDFRIDSWEGDLAGWRARVEHGDGLRPREDRRYRALRRVLRNRLAIRAFRWVHPDLGTAIATRSSQTSRTYQARDHGTGLRQIAAERLARGGIDLLIFGHTHVAELLRVNRAIYANAGSWLDQPTFLRITPERVELMRWDDSGSGEGVHLDALDRIAEKALT